MNKRYLVKLDKQERKALCQMVKTERIAAKKRTHAQVLLLADAGKQGPAWKDEAIAEACQVTVQTVENIRKRLVLEGLESAFIARSKCGHRVPRSSTAKRKPRSSPCAVAPCRRGMRVGRCGCWPNASSNWTSPRRFRTRPCGSV